MSLVFCISIRFLDPSPCFHGKRDGDEPEWPPSPLRLFQAIVDASASRWRNAQFHEYAVKSLEWYEKLPNPVIVAPTHQIGTPFRIAVPNNDLDSPASVWAKGREPDKPHRPIDLKTMKQVRPVHVRIEDYQRDALHYLYPMHDVGCPHEEVLKAAARSITHLGWGINMVAADVKVISQEDADRLLGERWIAGASGVPLRVPIPDTLTDLLRKHEAFLNRISAEGFNPTPPLSAFKVVNYRRANVPESRPSCAFSILNPEASANIAFSTPRRTRDVAAWIRHAVSEVYGEMWGDRASFVHGHAADGKQAKGDQADNRFQYLPIPTIEHRGEELGMKVTTIRRVMISAPAGFQDRIDFIRRRLLGQELAYEGTTYGLLNLLPPKDWVLQQYRNPAKTWSTVTPAILPGYDDRDRSKTHKLICKALRESGLPIAALEGCEFEWGPFGFRSGVEPARAFARPDHLTGTMVHLRVRFANPIPGPLAIGAGRYRGLGLFAAEG